MAKYVSEDGVKAIRDWVKVHDNKSLYNLGYYDTYDASTNTITRQTGYFTIEAQNIISTFTSGGSKVFCAETNIILPNATTDWNIEFGTSNIGYKVISVDGNWIFNKSIGGIGGQSVKIANNDFTTIDQFKALCPINIQYKMTTSYTEKVEKNHYARYNQDFILEHNKSEAERSANLFDDNGTNSVQYIGHFYTDDSVYNYSISPNNNYNCFRIRVEQNKTYYIKRSDGLILRFEDINNNLVDGLSLLNTGYGSFTTPNGCKYVVFSKNISSATNITMFNEGTEPLPYQPYEGKVVHEKDLGNYTNIYNVSQLYRHDIEFDILNGDGIKCTFWSTSNEKINDFSQIPYLAFSNIQVKNISNEKILNVVQWNSDGFRFYESDGTSTLIGDGYDGVTAYYINGEPQL